MTEPGEEGLVRALCAAVAAYDAETAGALVADGADPDRALPDGTTPLLRAVEGGSPAVVAALNDARPAWGLPQGERERLLDAARRWYAAGPEAELRRLTGARGPARTEVVQDGECGRVEEVTLGGRTVRGGHGAVLTGLEWGMRIPAPVGELVARAVGHPDEEHVDRSECLWVLLRRQSAQTWSEVAAFHRHPSPAHRAFAAEFLSAGLLLSGVTAHVSWYEKERAGLLAGWADTEPEGGVLARVLRLLSDDAHPDAQAFGLRYAAHPDPRVRREVPGLLDRPLDPGAARVVVDLARDRDGGVRARAAERLGGGEGLGARERAALLGLLRDEDPQVRDRALRAAAYDRSPETAEALLELLGAGEREVRLGAAYALAVRDHPGTAEAYERVGPLGPEYADDPRAAGLWRWRLRNEPGG
ncbi:HEAT repeat domain-containing protein [Streptomyces sp. NPDC029003]|uniref:HEAT repeat domain-containing protein n=1 Tax=Streptomyces sp. NPDC029003 TaxID=3155125 RepID=UPI0033F69F68